MGQAMTARAETELRIRDTYLNDHSADAGAVIDVVSREPAGAFTAHSMEVPANGSNHHFDLKGVSFDNTATDVAASYCMVNRCLKNQDRGMQNTVRRMCGIIHPESIQFIYPMGTTARGITVYG